MALRAGDWVEVRSKSEILFTLDEKGQLEGLPFMPQMFGFCGKRYQVYKRAHKTCDTVTKTGGRSLAHGVHLKLRCDGAAYGGCQADCLIFWKEAWLKPVADGAGGGRVTGTAQLATGAANCTEEAVLAGTVKPNQQPGDEVVYVCQATLLPEFTTLLPWWDVRQYLEDFTSGNVTFRQLFHGFSYAGFFIFWRKVSGVWWTLGTQFIRLYDLFQSLRGGVPFPRKEGVIPAGQKTQTCDLNLQPGELVRVRPYEDILATLDENNKNRGLYFDAELVPYCGGTYRVRSRLYKFLDENTGKLITTKNAAIILEDVWCQARYSDCRLFCPRSIYPWWREIWLERVEQETSNQ